MLRITSRTRATAPATNRAYSHGNRAACRTGRPLDPKVTKPRNEAMKVLLLLLAMTIGASPAKAISLSFAPDLFTPAVGDTISVAVVVAGLGAGVPPSVGAFDLTVAYDPSRLALSDLAFGSLLGSVPVEAVPSVVPGSSSVNFAEVSLLPPATLDALQPDSFTLATIDFSIIGAGGSTVTLSHALVSDGFGNSLAISGLGIATIVPEPATPLLLGSGIAGLVMFGRTKQLRSPARTEAALTRWPATA